MMKHLRVIIVAVLTGGILVFAFFWSRSYEQGFETPTECVNAFYQAALSNDEATMQQCMAQALHSEASVYISGKDDLRTFARYSLDITGDADAVVEMDEVREAAMHRVRIDLKRTSEGWHIVSIGQPKLIETDVDYGTSLNNVPDP